MSTVLLLENPISCQLWLFAMYFDFMSHIAQQLEKYREHSQSLVSKYIWFRVFYEVYCRIWFRNYGIHRVSHLIVFIISKPITYRNHFHKYFSRRYQRLTMFPMLCYAPIPSHKTNDPDLWNCGTEWVHSYMTNWCIDIWCIDIVLIAELYDSWNQSTLR